MTFENLLCFKFLVIFFSLYDCSSLISSHHNSDDTWSWNSSIEAYGNNDPVSPYKLSIDDSKLSPEEFMLKNKLDTMFDDAFKRRDSVSAMAIERFIDICNGVGSKDGPIPKDIEKKMILRNLLRPDGTININLIKVYASIKEKLPNLNYEM